MIGTINVTDDNSNPLSRTIDYIMAIITGELIPVQHIQQLLWKEVALIPLH